jgi:hypothetical protein
VALSEKSVGRPWDKVHSDIRAHLKFDNEVQRHILMHLRDMVATKPIRLENGYWGSAERAYRLNDYTAPNTFNVDRRTGILRRNRRRR